MATKENGKTKSGKMKSPDQKVTQQFKPSVKDKDTPSFASKIESAHPTVADNKQKGQLEDHENRLALLNKYENNIRRVRRGYHIIGKHLRKIKDERLYLEAGFDNLGEYGEKTFEYKSKYLYLLINASIVWDSLAGEFSEDKMPESAKTLELLYKLTENKRSKAYTRALSLAGSERVKISHVKEAMIKLGYDKKREPSDDESPSVKIPPQKTTPMQVAKTLWQAIKNIDKIDIFAEDKIKLIDELKKMIAHLQHCDIAKEDNSVNCKKGIIHESMEGDSVKENESAA